jgi:hypothetical protein
MTYHRFCNKSNTTGATSGTGTVYLSVAPEFTYNGQKKKDRQYNGQKKKDRQYNGQKKKDRQYNGRVCQIIHESSFQIINIYTINGQNSYDTSYSMV